MNKRYRDHQGRAIPWFCTRYARKFPSFCGVFHEVYPSGKAKITTIKISKRGRMKKTEQFVENHQEYVYSVEGRR